MRMYQRGARRKPKDKKATPHPKGRPRADRKLIMTTVWLTPEHMTLLDEICFYVGKNSRGSYRPNRSELMRLMIENLASMKRKLKKVQTPEEMRKALVR